MSHIPSEIRSARKLLRMISDLHVRGYQRLRAVPYLGGPGYWRCLIVPAHLTAAEHGARLVTWDGSDAWAPYTSANGPEYWGWRDTGHCTPGQLADVFLERWPALARLGYGPDWLYAGWFQHMLHLTYPDQLPLAFGDYIDANDVLVTTSSSVRIPLPPPGWAATSPRSVTKSTA